MRGTTFAARVIFLLATVMPAHIAPTAIPSPLWSPVATFSILGYDPMTGEIGGAVHDSDSDPDPAGWTKEGRQSAVMDAKGKYAAFTGAKATPWAGSKGGKYGTAQGNILAGRSGGEQDGGSV